MASPASPSSRLAWVDISNVIAMLCIVWGHVPCAAVDSIKPARHIFFTVPFFLLAGITFRLYTDKYRRTGHSHRYIIGRRLRSMLTPAVVFYLLFYVLWLAFGRTLAGDTEAPLKPLIDLLTGQPSTVLAAYWFLFCLITMQTAFYLLQVVIPRKTPLAVLCGLMPLALLWPGIPDCYQIGPALKFIPFLVMGWYIGAREYRPAALCGTLAYLILLPQYALGIDVRTELIAIPLGLLLLALIVILAKALGARYGRPWLIRTLRYGALVILATQNYIIGFVRILLDRLVAPDFLLQHYALKPLVVLLVYLITLPLILLIRDHCPWVLGKRRPAPQA